MICEGCGGLVLESPVEEIHRFFHPNKIALIGVSGSFGFGHGLPGFLIRNGWQNRICLVNPRLREIEGVPVFPSLEQVPGSPDLACIMVPAPAVLPVFRSCVEKGVKAVVVMSAGFAETGPEGMQRQQDLREEARRAGVRVMGPNCIGVVNVPHRFATCEISLEDLEPGTVSMVAQSGVFGNILLDAMPALGGKIAKVATIGNRADLDETDFLEYLAQDPETGVIVLYLESVLRGERFLAAASRASAKKPILACLGGRTEAGRRATRSHTGSLAGFRALDRAALRQAGIWIARDPQDLLETAKVFAACPVPGGGRTLVVTASGSLGVMAADRLAEEGLETAEPGPQDLARLREAAPAWMNLGNPLDVGPSGLFREALNVGVRSRDVDAVIAFPIIPWTVVAPLLRENRDAVASLFVDRDLLEQAALSKPIIVCPQGHPAWKEACRGFFGPRIPFVSTPRVAVRALGALCRYGRWKQARSGSVRRDGTR
jgi:acetate---CoA ligase (ADP-forming)